MLSFTLARKVDPRYKTNLIILIMTITLFIARGLFTNDWRWSLVFSAGFFLTWALAREIDPLHEKSAFVAAFIYLSMAMWIVKMNLGLVFWTVLLLRGVTGITGKKTTVLDLLGLMGLGIYLILGQENGIYGLIFTAAMVIGYRRSAKDAVFKVFILVGIVISVWGISSYSVLLPGEALQMDSFRVILLLVGLVCGTIYGRMLQKDQGIRDDLGEIIESKYVLLSYIFYLGMYAVLITGTDLDQGTLSLFFAVILGVALYRGWIMEGFKMKTIYYIPSILFVAFYGWLTVNFGFGGISPIAYVWIALLLGGAVLLSYGKFWGGIFGMITGVHWIYMSTIDTGQVINIELPLGLIILVYFTLCGGYVYYKSKEKKLLQQA